MLHGLVDTIADIWTAPDRWIEAELEAARAAAALEAARAAVAPPEAEVEDEVFKARFLELARTRQRQNGLVVCGLLRIVWPGPRLMGPPRDHRALTGMLGKSVLGQMAAAPDCFAQRDENTYLLCFASGNSAVAELRATMMAQALRASLVRGLPDQVASVRVESIVSEIDPVEIVLKHPCIAPGLANHFGELLSRQVTAAPMWIPRAA